MNCQNLQMPLKRGGGGGIYNTPLLLSISGRGKCGLVLAFNHARNKKTIHFIFGGKGFEISILCKGVILGGKNFIHFIQLEFWMSFQKLFHHILIFLMEEDRKS